MLGCLACAYSRYSGGIESSGENGQLVFGLALVAFGFSTFLPSLVRWSVSHGACAGKLFLVLLPCSISLFLFPVLSPFSGVWVTPFLGLPVTTFSGVWVPAESGIPPFSGISSFSWISHSECTNPIRRYEQLRPDFVLITVFVIRPRSCKSLVAFVIVSGLSSVTLLRYATEGVHCPVRPFKQCANSMSTAFARALPAPVI